MHFRHEISTELVEVTAGSHSAVVSLHRLNLPIYTGPRPSRTWRKPVVGPPARPFAELQVVDGLNEDGWCAAWVHRPSKFLSTWEPRTEAEMPPEAIDLHSRIQEKAGVKAGCWDVFAWRDGACLFAELKRARSSDRVRKSQLIWREAAMEIGVPDTAFAVVEWSGGTI